MSTLRSASVLAGSALSVLLSLAAAERPELALDGYELISEIVFDQADPGHRFVDFPAGASQTATILGRPCRVLANPDGGSVRYLAVRLAEGAGLQAGRPYLLEVVYPEDQPRCMLVLNQGCERVSGFHTGGTVGDALHAPYVGSNAESIDYPLTGGWQRWQTLFHLHHRTPGIKRPRGTDADRPLEPADGFWVVLAHWQHSDAPLSAGIAVHAIRVYRAPDRAARRAPLVRPPAALRQRHVLYREEMFDGATARGSDAERGVPNAQDTDFYEWRAQQMEFLGIDTYSLDLLEFGANQGWDSTPYGGNDWVYQSHKPQRWTSLLQRLRDDYDFHVLPYYEYAGSKGANGLGFERRCATLGQRGLGPDGRDDYTHISWSESANADLTDPDTFDDLGKMLDLTVLRERNGLDFVGVWLRPRPSQHPISFSDRCLGLFATEANDGVAITRGALQERGELYDRYLDWWFERRRQFLIAVRDFLRDGGITDPTVLYTTDATEGGVNYPSWTRRLVTDRPELWPDEHPIALSEAIASQRNFIAQTSPRLTWGDWEWEHAVPPADPQRYAATPGVLLTHTFHHLFTVGDPDALAAFTGPSGLAMIRHHNLNEDAFAFEGDKRVLGYLVADVEQAGPYGYLAEARALAHGDQRFLGYLAANSYARGFPAYARAFNRAFLALPAIASQRLPEAADHAAVVVRRYDGGSHGIWYAVINTGLVDADAVRITLPDAGPVTDLLSGADLPRNGARIELDCWPGQVHALHLATDGHSRAIDIGYSGGSAAEILVAHQAGGEQVVREGAAVRFAGLSALASQRFDFRPVLDD